MFFLKPQWDLDFMFEIKLLERWLSISIRSQLAILTHSFKNDVKRINKECNFKELQSMSDKVAYRRQNISLMAA